MNGVGEAGLTMRTQWMYATVTRSCDVDPVTDAAGLAFCTRGIGGATVGRQVNIDVSMLYQGNNYTATTWFVPQ